MKHIKTRIFSFFALITLAAGCGGVVGEGFYIATDSYIAPAILGPENDLVLEQKMKLSAILLEKGKAQSLVAEADADIEAGEKAVAQLNDLKIMASGALGWTKTTTNQQVSVGSADIRTLSSQKSALGQMLTRQTVIVDEARKQLEAGLILKPDYTKEIQSLDQIQIAIFENDRSRMQTELLLGTATLGQQALYSKHGAPMPEMVMSADQLVRIECQLLETEATMRAKTAERIKLREELTKIDELETQLHSRPLFKAIDSQLDVAFVSYSSLKDITPGSRLMDCVWGIFKCKDVGTVISIIPGEAILPDIFTSGQVRGQFITLDLNKTDRADAMQSKILRVRGKKPNQPNDNQTNGISDLAVSK